LRILIVDDKRENRYLLETMLGATGYTTESASNGIEALDLLKKQHFDAIISDLLMPKMDGFQLIRTCKKDPGLSKIPFIIYTATYTDKKDVDFGLSLGAARYLIKPAEPDVLLRELEETLGQVTVGTLEETGPVIENNGTIDQEYVRRLVAKLDKKILDLEKSEEKYRVVFENTGTATVVLEQNNIISLANEEFANISGFTKNDIEGKKYWTEFVHNEDLERMLAQHRLRRQGGENALTRYEFRFVTKSGDIRNIYLSIDGIPGTTKSVASLLDITDRKRSEEALRESEEKFRNVFDWTNDAILLHTLTTTETPGRFIDVNKGACLMLGYTRDELLRLGPSDIVPADQHPLLGEIIRQAAAEESVLFETRFLRKDGTTVPVESSGHLVTYGRQKIWISHVRNITLRKQAEEQRERLMQELSQRNAELDRFSYTVSHDLKSPLLSIRGFLGLLEMDMKSGDTPRILTDITRINESAKKLEHLITTLLALSRGGRIVDEPVRIPWTDLAREAAGLLAGPLNEHHVRLVIPDNLPAVTGDRQRLLQVMTNLLDNAVKFMGGQEEPCIEVGVREEAATPVFFVRDNGMGIINENLPKVFGLFERFNKKIPGTGIGLATVKRIIEAHGGRIWVDSEGEGKGSTFLFTLPVSEDT
jgi:two-component system, LuxR family, sensor kinase FixL